MRLHMWGNSFKFWFWFVFFGGEILWLEEFYITTEYSFKKNTFCRKFIKNKIISFFIFWKKIAKLPPPKKKKNHWFQQLLGT